MTDAVTALARAALDRRLDRGSAAPLAIAVSGGGDSMALLLLAAAWSREADRRLLVLSVDHRLNPQSTAWAQVVFEVAERLGLDHRVLSWEGAKPVSGLPAAARRARHALLAEAARGAGARVILMGHTADDLAEAEQMRAGGSSVGDPREWGPSPAWPEGRGVFLLRPLLACRRDDLRRFLRAMAQSWIEDPANADPRFARSRARRTAAGEPTALLLPTRPLRSDVAAEETSWGGLRLERAGLGSRRLLSAALLCASGRTEPPRGVRLTVLADRLAEGSGGTLAGARAVLEGGGVLLGRDSGRGGLGSVPAAPGRELVWDGRFAMTAEEDGSVGPLAGRQGRLSKTERAALRTMPAWARPALPLLETPSGAVRLLPDARPLALERLRAACGVYDKEADLTAA